MTEPIYLDYNATTPLSPTVATAMEPFLRGGFGNPSSSHRFGRSARDALEQARRQVADLLGAAPEEVVFTGGGTESNNIAIAGVAQAHRDRGRHIVTSAVEHPAVTEVCRALALQGYEVTFVPVDEEGRVAPDDVAAALRSDTVLVSIMHANNEVGTVQPLAAIAAMAREAGVLFHTDAAQSVGKLPTRVAELGVDLLSVAGHKLYGPKGVGALYVRDGVSVSPVLRGAGHERGIRPGTENVLAIVGLGAACEQAASRLPAYAEHMRTMRDRLERGLVAALGADVVRLNGHRTERLPNTLNVSLMGVAAEILLDHVGEHLAASAGAACHSGEIRVSHVLSAMGLDAARGQAALRLSTGRETTASEVDQAVRILAAVHRQLV